LSTWQLTADLVGEGLAELQALLPYGFMADHNAASGEHLIAFAVDQVGGAVGGYLFHRSATVIAGVGAEA
jgi:hypothetical protein